MNTILIDIGRVYEPAVYNTTGNINRLSVIHGMGGSGTAYTSIEKYKGDVIRNKPLVSRHPFNIITEEIYG